MATLGEVKERVLRKVVPDAQERAAVDRLITILMERISTAFEKTMEGVEVRLDGSVAKNTWLSGEADIDIFLRVPPEKSRSFLEGECLQMAKRALKGYRTIERFAEHPYIESYVDGIRVNIVPCFKVEKGLWLSATDRTPYHTEYMQAHLGKDLQNEVRLLKRLLKSSGLYGAEVKVKGFSGFLCEILTLYYGSFEATLSAASNWRLRELIDIAHWYKGREADALTLFTEPLIVVDPIDMRRNVASAVAPRSLWEFVALSRIFLEDPSVSFFFPKRPAPNLKTISQRIGRMSSDLIVLHIGRVDAVIDVVWSQLYKTERILRRVLSRLGFRVIRTKSYCSDDGDCSVMFELDGLRLNSFAVHTGPPVYMRESSDRFLRKHLRSRGLAGPWIEDDRWMTKIRRRYVDAKSTLKTLMADGGVGLGVPSRVAAQLAKGGRILVNEQALKLCREDRCFSEALSRFLEGRPVWLAGGRG